MDEAFEGVADFEAAFTVLTGAGLLARADFAGLEAGDVVLAAGFDFEDAGVLALRVGFALGAEAVALDRAFKSGWAGRLAKVKMA